MQNSQMEVLANDLKVSKATIKKLWEKLEMERLALEEEKKKLVELEGRLKTAEAKANQRVASAYVDTHCDLLKELNKRFLNEDFS